VPDEQLPPRATPLPAPAPLLRAGGGALPPAVDVPTGLLLCVLELLTTFREPLGLVPPAEGPAQQHAFHAPLPDMLQELARHIGHAHGHPCRLGPTQAGVLRGLGGCAL
jgi:hypothetical protein